MLVGGWTPDLLLRDASETHVGSLDVDLALDADRLREGRYAELLHLLLGTGRYQAGAKPFQLVAEVDLGDGDTPIIVEVEFLAPDDVVLEKHSPKLVEEFRVLQVPSARSAFHSPVDVQLAGPNVLGVKNSVTMRVVSIADFLVMKAHAIDGRDKPKDSYDLCYSLDHFPRGMGVLAEEWKQRMNDEYVVKAIDILHRKFADVNTFGPQQVVEFHASTDPEIREMQARRAYELVREFLEKL